MSYEERMKKRQELMLNQLKPLVGGVIVGLADGDEGFFGLVIQTVASRKTLVFQSDDEGNDPGSFRLE